MLIQDRAFPEYLQSIQCQMERVTIACEMLLCEEKEKTLGTRKTSGRWAAKRSR